MPKRMWFNNPRDKKVKRRSDLSFKILNGYKNIDRKKDSRTRGHEVTLVKDQCRLDIRKYSFYRLCNG